MKVQFKKIEVPRVLSPVNPVKLPYAQVAMTVDKMYDKPMPDDEAAIVEHVTLIAEMIRAMGWTEDEYGEKWMEENGDRLTELEGDLHLTQDQPS